MAANPNGPPNEPQQSPQTPPDIGHGHPEYHFVQGLLLIQQGIDSVRSKVESMSGQLGRLDAKIEELDKRLGKVEAKVSALEKTMTRAGGWIAGVVAFSALLFGIYKLVESHISITIN